ncbi:alpha beta hydrolase fold-3 domain protein [Lactobacillus hamsteri DSM 5661 = JCM 6256]|uniref:Alpha beta hydrolase fold-3 domain protein n=1 Tax=Lactobacillus hamsteri DSM 5661 = JCM 6256 TaxID=1423754 RepID=A0A0R1YI58_9LACO|nr:alpha beta hydrolase fold-3 domain protein [Lactobacillus hamsteri DSM 5661 = JCM 6256]
MAPETPFPGAYLDIKEFLEWIMNHQSKISFIDSQVYMTGDSAGGELCVACGLTDKKHQIRKLFPMYAALDITDTNKTMYHWQYSDYDMDPSEEKFIRARLNKFIYVNNVIRLLYPGNDSVENPLISPVYAHDFSDFPDITMIEAEFDYYLQSNKYFAKKLRQAGKNVEEVLYKGIDHGFLDRSRSCNQSEDMLQLIAKEINK